MNYDLLFVVIFGLVVLGLMLINRKRTELQKIAFPFLYMIIYRTKLGLKNMDRLAAKHPKSLNVLSYISIFTGYLGMAFIIFFLFKGLYDVLFFSAPSPVGLVLPGIQIAPNIPILSFWHWIIAIFILASVHEFSHGVFARLNKIKVKSSGFAFLGILLPIIPAAFVEPDEKDMEKASKKAQISVLAAGSFANFLTALVVFFIMMAVAVPIGTHFIDQPYEIVIKGIDDGGPLDLAGVTVGEKISGVNGVEVTTLEEIFNVLNETSPSQIIPLTTDKKEYSIKLTENPRDESKGYLGVQIGQTCSLMDYKGCQNFKSSAYGWIYQLLWWLFLINLGVGMFNLLPLGILDGGKMFYLATLYFTKSEVSAKKIFKYANIILILVLLFLILPSLYNSLISPLISFII